MYIVQKALRFAQTHYNVGEPTKHFCLLRCLDIISPFMLLKRNRSGLEVGYKLVWLSIMFCIIMGLTYDILRQSDIRAAVDIICIFSLFVCVYVRPICLYTFRADINRMERLDADPRFRVGTPYGDAIRQQVVHKDNVYLGWAIVLHFFTVTIYTWHNLSTQESFLTLITYWPTDLSENSPRLDKLAQAAYCMTAYVWGWAHASGHLTVIVMLRMATAEFRVLLHSLATLDEQIDSAHQANPGASLERIVCDLLREHAAQHSELVMVMMRLRAMMRMYTLVHISMNMAIAAAFLTRIFVLTGSSSLGLVVPLLATVIYCFETLIMCLLVEHLTQLNRTVGFTLYSFDWSRCLPFWKHTKNTIMLMIMQSNNTNEFSAAGLTNVSAKLFATSCRLIYSMMMCMANLTNAGA